MMPVQPQRWRKQAIARMMLVLLNCQGIFDMSQHTQHVCFMYTLNDSLLSTSLLGGIQSGAKNKVSMSKKLMMSVTAQK